MDVLQTERLLVREWTTGDLEELHRILSDPITMRFWPAPFTLDATKAWIERSVRQYAELGCGRWAVVLQQANALIGECGILHTDVAGRLEYDLGYIIHHPYWRRGYASEAAEACKRYAVTTLGIRRLVANMPVEHIASMRVAEKIGIRRERTFSNPKNRGVATYLYVFECESNVPG